MDCEMIERIAEAIYDFLDERFPDGAMPGGQQLFADDPVDAEFKHEAGCEALAKAAYSVMAGRIEELEGENQELRAERDALLQEPINLPKMDSIDEDASGKMVAYYWWRQALEARAALPSTPSKEPQ